MNFIQFCRLVRREEREAKARQAAYLDEVRRLDAAVSAQSAQHRGPHGVICSTCGLLVMSDQACSYGGMTNGLYYKCLNYRASGGKGLCFPVRTGAEP